MAIIEEQDPNTAAGIDQNTKAPIQEVAPMAPPPPSEPSTSDKLLGASGEAYAGSGNVAAATSTTKISKEAKPGDTINIVNSEGKTFSIPVEDAPKALSQGYKIETPEGAAVREYLKENKGITGDVKQGLLSFANETLFGVPDIIDQHTLDPLTLAKREGLKKEHQAASTIGAVGGFGASLFTGEALFSGAAKAGKAVEAGVMGLGRATATKAAEEAAVTVLGERLAATATTEAGAKAAELAAPSLFRKATAAAAKMGVEGAIISAPPVITEAGLGDYQKAGETLLWGVGAGAALGAVTALGSAGLGKAKTAITEALGPNPLENFSQEQAWKSLDPKLKFSKAAEELPGGMKGVGQELLKKGPDGKALVRDAKLIGGEAIEEQLPRVEAARDKMGETINSIYKKVDTLPGAQEAIPAEDLINKFRSNVADPIKTGIKAVGNENVANAVDKYIESMEANYKPNANGCYSFESLHDMRQHIGAQTKWRLGESAETESINQAKKQMYGIISKELEAKGNVIAKADNWAFSKELQDSNLAYRKLKLAAETLEDTISTRATNRSVSPSDYAFGHGIGIGSAVASIASGNPAPLIWGAMKGVAGSIMHKQLRQNGNAMAATAADKFGILLAEQSNKLAAQQLDRLPAILRGDAPRGAVIKEAGSVMQRFLGKKDRGETKHEQFEDISNQLSQFVSNHDASSAGVAHLSGGIADTGAPNVASAYTMANIRAMQYLYNSMPKPANADVPFSGTKWKPSDKELQDWEDKIAVVQNPFVVIDKLQNKTLTSSDVDAFRAVYPSLYDSVKGKIAEVAADPKKAGELPYAVRQKISLLTGVNLDPQNTAFYQKTFAKEDQKQKGSKIKAPNLGTDTQRIAGK